MAGWKFAWWYLTRRQKEALKEQRMLGRFGGTGKPSYWPLQEAGMPEVGIKARRFVKESQLQVRKIVPDVMSAVLLGR